MHGDVLEPGAMRPGLLDEDFVLVNDEADEALVAVANVPALGVGVSEAVLFPLTETPVLALCNPAHTRLGEKQAETWQ